MCCNFPTIKITEGNAFTLIFPLKRRSYVAEKPIDEDIDVTRLNDVHVMLGGVEYAPTIETYGVRIDVPATLVRGTYDGLLTADYDGNAIRGAYESCVQIVAWNAQSNAQQYILGSPVATNAAYGLGHMPTVEEIEELKQQLREQIAAAEQAEAVAIAEKERYAEALEHLGDIAKQGYDPEVSLTSLSEIIEGLDISKVAKQGTDRTATNTSISDRVDEIIATIGGEADVNAVYLGLLNRQTDYQAEGFPDKQDLPHLPQAVAAFTPRKISNGGAENDGIPDGISLAQLFGTTLATSVTEIVDDNVGWTMNKNMAKFLSLYFPNITHLMLGCENIQYPIIQDSNNIKQISMQYLKLASTPSHHTHLFMNLPNCKSIEFPQLEQFTTNYSGGSLCYGVGCDKLSFPKFKRFKGDNGFRMFENCDNLKVIEMPNSEYIETYVNIPLIAKCYNLQKVVLGTTGRNQHASSTDCIFGNKNYEPITTDNLIHLEFGANGVLLSYKTSLCQWSPTNALDASRTDLIEEGSTATNNLQQFLQNFKTYIAERLTDKGKGLTLTLSQEVRNAIHAAEDEYGIENIIITKKGWTISPAPN